MNKLETERLLFRLYGEDDRKDFLALFTDKSVMEYVDTGVLTVEKADDLWRKLIDDFYPQGIATIYALFTKESTQFIGQAWIRPRPSKKEDWEIGYVLKKDAWGKGFATEVARELIDFGFTKLNLPEVFATIDNDNSGSIKVAEKSGMNFLRYEFDEEGSFSVYSIKKI